MTYVMMIYETEGAFAERTDPAKSEKYWAAWGAYPVFRNSPPKSV